MNILKAVFTIIVLLSLALLVLFIDFTYKTFSYRQNVVKSDAVVVLTGGRGRVAEGVRIFKEGGAKYLIIVGADRSVRKSDIYKQMAGDPPADRVILEKNSKNTIENAIYGSSIIRRYNISSMLLITSRYHLKRATILLRNAIPKDCVINPYPIESSNLKYKWWEDSGSIALLFSEFYKYCILKIFFMFAPGELRSGYISPSVSSNTVSALFKV